MCCCVCREPSFKCVFPDASPSLTVDGLVSLHDQFVGKLHVMLLCMCVWGWWGGGGGGVVYPK